MPVYVDDNVLDEDLVELLEFDAEGYTVLSADIDEPAIKEKTLAIVKALGKVDGAQTRNLPRQVQIVLSVMMSAQINLFGHSYNIEMKEKIQVKKSIGGQLYTLNLSDIKSSGMMRRGGRGDGKVLPDEVTIWRWPRVWRHELHDMMSGAQEIEIAKYNTLYQQFGLDMGMPSSKCYPTFMYITENRKDAENMINVYKLFESQKLGKDPEHVDSLTNSVRKYFRSRPWFRAQGGV
jgi:hypothetical protein